MFCPKCGNQLPEEANFCPKCGAEFSKNSGNIQNNTNNGNAQNSNKQQFQYNIDGNQNSNNYQQNNERRTHFTTKELRAEARQCLTGKWGKSALIMLIYSIILIALRELFGLFTEHMSYNVLKIVISIIETIITIPVTFGLTISLIKIKRGEAVELFDFLKTGFKNFVRSLKINLRILLKLIVPIAVVMGVILLISMLEIVITSAVETVTGSSSTNGGIPIIGVILYFILFIAGYLFIYIVSLRYAVSYNIAYDEPNLTAKEIVEKSKKIMKGRKGDFFVLMLTFMGWVFLTWFTVGIGLLWLIPYMLVAQTCFYDRIREDEGI